MSTPTDALAPKVSITKPDTHPLRQKRFDSSMFSNVFPARVFHDDSAKISAFLREILD
jgi:hypothetical protein